MRILLVEDDAALGGVIQRGLVEEGHAVDWERTVAGALFALSLAPYALVVLDIGLPDGNGLAVCRWLREQDAATRVLVLTARDFRTLLRDSPDIAMKVLAVVGERLSESASA